MVIQKHIFNDQSIWHNDVYTADTLLGFSQDVTSFHDQNMLSDYGKVLIEAITRNAILRKLIKTKAELFCLHHRYFIKYILRLFESLASLTASLVSKVRQYV